MSMTTIPFSIHFAHYVVQQNFHTFKRRRYRSESSVVYCKGLLTSILMAHCAISKLLQLACPQRLMLLLCASCDKGSMTFKLAFLDGRLKAHGSMLRVPHGDQGSSRPKFLCQKFICVQGLVCFAGYNLLC